MSVLPNRAPVGVRGHLAAPGVARTCGPTYPVQAAAFEAAEPELSTRTCRDGSGKGSSNAIITIGGVVQSVPRYEGVLRNSGMDRISHQRKTREKPNPFLLCDIGDHALHHWVAG